MDATMRIAEVARRSGFPAGTLRYYEQRDLLPAPRRTEAGYRAYDESVLDRLAFIARAKTLGCSLEEIADLLPTWDAGRCAPVQDGLRGVAEAKVREVQARVAEMEAFTADLQRIIASLGPHTPDGPCDSHCGCAGDASPPPGPLTPAMLGPKRATSAAPPVACSLADDQVAGRVQEWRAVLAHVGAREVIDGGVRLQLHAATPVERLVQLVGAEQECCAFFAFAITVDGRGLGLEVRAPADAMPVVASLFGPAA